ncbi:hypothetical protein GCM10007920_42700 [Ciceribacter naphthalenivorans]|uniref:Uncharacterized protein n=2 Tax=Alphaproteobacteria TaxID=28211 RepID=A0A512HII1_9HYPH|nr:hypothetical protein RNA01_21220 [Ciceribacter naphthalenivorans]GLR24476.1 hypothetical protein GCM10007920_42700 [Ciceribacter naphthalenivorans]GLT07332.1 hypothetical protein GCM10007926_42700 [Sphingomonas psychrolutea]
MTPGDYVGEPPKFPGSISDFDAAILHYETLVEDARNQVIRNEDAEKLENKHIREETRYIVRQNKLIAERTRKGLKIPPEIYSNIEGSQEAIAEANEVLRLLPGHKAAWAAERDRRRKWLSYLRKERSKGIGKSGEVRKCGSRNTTTGAPCQNEKHYRKGSGWGVCLTPGH